MVSRRITENGDDAADTVAAAGRRAARRTADAYDATTDEFEERVDSLEATIRRNPIAAAGAALLVGVVLGRFVL